MILLFLRLLLTIGTAFLVGKLVSKVKLPSILGWLITGMVLGPHALSLMNQQLLDTQWYQTVVHILECGVGLMIGTELVWNKIKRSGKAIVITTLTQSLGTFLLVSLVFGIVFYVSNIPVYLAFIFGGIALATAPAPALSIVREFKTTGPVTKTLIPMAALDDIVGCIVFLTTIAIVAGNLSAGDLPAYMIALVVILPLLIGVVTGLAAGLVLKKERSKSITLMLLIVMIIVASAVGFIFNTLVLPRPVLNFMLIGMAFSATFSNMISEMRLEQIMDGFNPILGVSMIVVILNLGAPLDYHLILGAGLFTAIYILARAAGKYFGAYFGASITKSPETVKKYLGLTLLPHSGVSLVLTGIAVSVLAAPAPECAKIVQGTIAAAAVINEIIAVITAKKGFEWAGEMNSATNRSDDKMQHIIITISRQHGSGGREIGRK
ncbi:MAG TPA: cation:proton antiporter, partial [Thermotogota bacterium]|nr:cation:proton antiporter [Thermotogota bacterium]